ncbi:DUF5777 family beta-barrel protein [uncultured Tenacibaculum sp.]|uniref:DUF5777 family beta-barrel protein n=1 Tax=uncultured Tenacibaculum sp. TaxID=174713 RepID=UPI002627FBB1|nr:DUF5777 family beta-barrel protein [uncultured Tenacibaculum sp.]
MYTKINTFLIILLAALQINAQDDLLNELDNATKDVKQFDLPAFKAMQIGNLQSTKIADKGDLYLVVAHRFGSLKDGIDEFFGLDQANTKIQLLYSFWDHIQLGLSRDSFEKTYSGTIKFGLTKQSNKFPLNIVGYASADINSEIKKANYPNLKFGDRMSYTFQLLASRRVSKNLSLQVAPSFVRQNLQDLNATKERNHNQFLMGIGGRLKVSKRMSINLDYAYNFNKNKNSIYNNPLTLGVDIETGGHVFQLLFSNARGSNDSAFLTKAQGDWSKGDISFGFNVVRVF